MAASCVAWVTFASAFARERMPKKMTSATTATALAGIHHGMRGAEGGGAAAGWAAATAAAGVGESVAGASTCVVVWGLLDSAFIGSQTSPWSLCVHFVQLCCLRKFCSRIALSVQETENGRDEN